MVERYHSCPIPWEEVPQYRETPSRNLSRNPDRGHSRVPDFLPESGIPAERAEWSGLRNTHMTPRIPWRGARPCRGKERTNRRVRPPSRNTRAEEGSRFSGRIYPSSGSISESACFLQNPAPLTDKYYHEEARGFSFAARNIAPGDPSLNPRSCEGPTGPG